MDNEKVMPTNGWGNVAAEIAKPESLPEIPALEVTEEDRQRALALSGAEFDRLIQNEAPFEILAREYCRERQLEEMAGTLASERAASLCAQTELSAALADSNRLVLELQKELAFRDFIQAQKTNIALMSSATYQEIMTALGTERTMHAAWRKRAEHSEAEFVELQKEVAGARALRSAGQRMSNLLYNLAQQKRFIEPDTALMNDAVKEWDAAKVALLPARDGG